MTRWHKWHQTAWLWAGLALGVIFSVGLVLARHTSISLQDARDIWTVYPHTLPDFDAGAAAFVKAMARDFAQAIQLARTGPLQTLLLNGWALLFGESQVILRLLNLLVSLLAFAALYRLGAYVGRPIALIVMGSIAAVMLLPFGMRLYAMMDVALFLWAMVAFLRWRDRPATGRLVLFSLLVLLMITAAAWLYLAMICAYVVGVALRLKWWRLASIITIIALLLMVTADWFFGVMTLSEPDWQRVADETAALREPLSPAVYTLPEDHPLLYYDRQMGLLNGVAVNVGWQAFSASELADIVDHMQQAPQIWAFVQQNDVGSQVLSVLSSGRQVTYEQSALDVLIARYDQEP
ncbi:hypothetical protein G4Y79_00155 [Phototrophicus methaneseepsis]|uniref:Glycosyltransferase RgtA/B/C/D-like domain-containing protein n=1 Tax=Phototrophicus methaneseepsis TaxID=2710758 RepID=A0A7S8E9P2_9CHLR|nr:hypothetical protein [Phototrophicus methaneseepsis]QPC82823.1 hypothetical protein G4Y79_00155 [Phototrophicus methaneseepsis]